MGEAQNQPFQLAFNPRLRIEFQGSRVTSDGGLVLVRELDERLGVGGRIAQHIPDPRGKNTQFPLADLVRQSIYRRLAGDEDVNDAERLAHDPTFRLIGSSSFGSVGRLRRRGCTRSRRSCCPGRELCEVGGNQPGVDRAGGSDGVLAAGGARHRRRRLTALSVPAG